MSERWPKASPTAAFEFSLSCKDHCRARSLKSADVKLVWRKGSALPDYNAYRSGKFLS